MTQATTLDTFKNFLEKYSLKQSAVACGMGIEKATLNHYLVKGTRRNKFYERALLDLLAQMRYDIDQVFVAYMSDEETIKLVDSSRNLDYSVVTVTYTREEWEKMQASDATPS